MFGFSEGDAVETVLAEYSGTLLLNVVEIDVGSALGTTVESFAGESPCNDDGEDDDEGKNDVLGDDIDWLELGRLVSIADGSSVGSAKGSKVGDSDMKRLEGKHDGGRLDISVTVVD
jgi:hypothetical protein